MCYTIIVPRDRQQLKEVIPMGSKKGKKKKSRIKNIARLMIAGAAVIKAIADLIQALH